MSFIIDYLNRGDDLLSSENELRVKLNPGYGEFSSISDALNSITTNTINNRFIIKVFPGEYVEPELDFSAKPYVSLVGSSIQSVVIKPAGNHHIMKLGVLNEVSYLWLEDAPTGFAAIAILDSGEYSQCHKVTFNNCYTGILITSVTQDTFFYGEYIDMNGDFIYGVRMESSNGFECYANLENFYVLPTVANPSTHGVYLTGTTTECYINTAGITGVDIGHGIHVQNGAELNFTSGYISHMDIGVINPNVGSGAIILLTALEMHANVTLDIDILHPNTIGTFGGSSNHTMITNDAPGFVWAFLDANNGEFEITKQLSVTFDDGTHTDLSTLVFEGSTMGVIDGGDMTDGGGLNVDVAAGFGYLDDNDIIKRYDWGNSTVALTASSDNYIFINELGTLTASVGTPTTLYNVIYLGRVHTHSSGIEFIDDSKMDSHHLGNKLSSFNRVALGNIYASGSTITEGAALKLNVTAGLYFRSEVVFTPSGGSDITFTEYRYNGSSTWVRTSTDTVNNTHYNNGTTYTALTAGYFTKHSLYVVSDNGNEQYFLVLGQAEYSSLLLAQSGTIPTPPNYFNKGVCLIGLIYVQQGVGNIVSIDDARPVIGFRPPSLAGASDHGSLTGLGNDDHTQYLLTAGGRTMSGNLDLGNNNIINVNLVDGVDISSHASRHLPNGADPLTTAAPTTNLNGSSTNTEGIQNSFSRSDHTHVIDEATTTVAGLLSAADKVKLDDTSNINTGDQTITLTGDVTGSGTGSFTTTIANDSVTFAKMQNITTDRLLGRSTALSGDVEEISIGTGLSLAAGILTATAAGLGISNVSAAGDITTTSATDVVSTSMSITPGAGTYLALFSSDIAHNTNGGVIQVSLYANGVLSANSTRTYTRGSQTLRCSVFTQSLITVTAGQAIDVRWNRGASGTGTMGNRSLILIKQ